MADLLPETKSVGPRCSFGNMRHWFAPYGQPGTTTHECVRCGAPNPRWKAGSRCWNCSGKGYVYGSDGSHGATSSECHECGGTGRI